MRTSKLFREFFNSEKNSGIVLILCTVLSLCLANFFVGESYVDFWHRRAGLQVLNIDLRLSIEHWVNDGFMTIFFLLIGLEIKSELYEGELSSIKNASLPVAAAIGGMAIPALFHFILNNGTPAQSGFGIPMATDIAFSLGILSLAGKRVPLALKVFLTALAIIDDLGAILIIAIFYTGGLQFTYLFSALGLFVILLLLNKLKVYQLRWYLLGGVLMWYCMLHSGIHATITGVLLAFAIPFKAGKGNSISYKLQHWLHKPVAFLVVPLFAFANTGIIITGNFQDMLLNNNSLGIIAGLVLGKPIGILLFALMAVKINMARLPEGINWWQLAAVGMLAGIGFTMSIFITLLAFDSAAMIQYSKIAIFVSSLIAGMAGFLLLKKTMKGPLNSHRNQA